MAANYLRPLYSVSADLFFSVPAKPHNTINSRAFGFLPGRDEA